jgi:hypothetical protein
MALRFQSAHSVPVMSFPDEFQNRIHQAPPHGLANRNNAGALHGFTGTFLVSPKA